MNDSGTENFTSLLHQRLCNQTKKKVRFFLIFQCPSIRYAVVLSLDTKECIGRRFLSIILFSLLKLKRLP